MKKLFLFLISICCCFCCFAEVQKYENCRDVISSEVIDKLENNGFKCGACYICKEYELDKIIDTPKEEWHKTGTSPSPDYHEVKTYYIVTMKYDEDKKYYATIYEYYGYKVNIYVTILG